MRRLLLPLLAFLLIQPAAASAQWGGVIGVYAEPCACYCQVSDTPGPKTLYVMQKFTPGSSGSRFRIELSDGFTGTLVSVSSPYTGISGDPLTGVTVNYDGACLPGNILILDLNFLFLGTSTECSWVRAAAHPLSVDGQLETYNCITEREPADWQGTHVKHDLARFCPDDSYEGQHEDFCRPYTPPLPVDHSTWGAVKALYR